MSRHLKPHEIRKDQVLLNLSGIRANGVVFATKKQTIYLPPEGEAKTTTLRSFFFHQKESRQSDYIYSSPPLDVYFIHALRIMRSKILYMSGKKMLTLQLSKAEVMRVTNQTHLTFDSCIIVQLYSCIVVLFQVVINNQS